jgi:hypothetical protein
VCVGGVKCVVVTAIGRGVGGSWGGVGLLVLFQGEVGEFAWFGRWLGNGAARLDFFAWAVSCSVGVGPYMFQPCVPVEGVEALKSDCLVFLFPGVAECSESSGSEPLCVGPPVGRVEPADGGVVINDGVGSGLSFPLDDVSEFCFRVACFEGVAVKMLDDAFDPVGAR